MGSIILMAFIQNVFIFCMVFWALTWVGEWYAGPKEHKTKRQIYECGFRALSDLNLEVNLNFSLVCAFLILYDVEFTFLFPFLFNSSMVDSAAFFAAGCFFTLLVLALFYDFNQNATDVTL
jgi:NADH:ubiquinone oxidoreductase subunit 3 (subunit A)